MEGEDLEPRVSALENEMREVRRRLRDFRRATLSSVNALRADLTDLRRDFVESRSESGRGFAEMRSKFDLTAAGQQQIVAMLQTLIDREPR